MTPEQLGVWFTENALEKRMHTEEIPLTEETRLQFREKIANATAAIYDLKDIEKSFKDALNNGTTYNGQERLPQDFTIPPTKGLKELEANRQFADKILKQGFTTTETEVFGIPYKKDIVFFDAGGVEYFREPLGDRALDPAATTPLFDSEEPSSEVKKIAKDFHKGLEKSGMKVTGFDSDTNTMHIEVKAKDDPLFE